MHLLLKGVVCVVLCFICCGLTSGCSGKKRESHAQFRLRQKGVLFTTIPDQRWYSNLPGALPGKMIVIPPFNWGTGLRYAWNDERLHFALEDLRAIEDMHYLLMRYTGISDAALRDIGTLSQVRHLNFEHTDITDAGIEHLGAMPNLNGLYLFDTRGIRGHGLAALARCPLKQLDLSETWIEDSVGESLSVLRQLKYVELSCTRIRGNTLRVLGALPELEELWIAYTGITDDDIIELKPATKLERLNVSADRLSLSSLEQLCRLPALKYLAISGGDVSDSDLASLRRNFSSVTISVR